MAAPYLAAARRALSASRSRMTLAAVVLGLTAPLRTKPGSGVRLPEPALYGIEPGAKVGPTPHGDDAPRIRSINCDLSQWRLARPRPPERPSSRSRRCTG
jgi:hypothetical protein